MDDLSRYSGYGDIRAGAIDRPALFARVFGLLGFAFLFTAGGAVIGIGLGPGGFLLSIIGSFATLIPLLFLKERSPFNLILLYAFAAFEGMAVGLILNAYIAQGLGTVVLNAALTTGAISLAAGGYGATTKRDLSRLGPLLLIGLLGILVASLLGFFLQLPGLYLILSVIAVVVFTGLLAYDLNRVANSHNATEGQAILLAVGIYLDILNLFLALLRIFGAIGGSSRD